MNNNNNDNAKNDPSKTQDADQGKQAAAPAKDQEEAGTEKREAADTGSDKK